MSLLTGKNDAVSEAEKGERNSSPRGRSPFEPDATMIPARTSGQCSASEEFPQWLRVGRFTRTARHGVAAIRQHSRPRSVPFNSFNIESNVHLLLRGTLRASDIPTISFVSQPVGRFTDCNKK
jgi:hypothetical protein